MKKNWINFLSNFWWRKAYVVYSGCQFYFPTNNHLDHRGTKIFYWMWLRLVSEQIACVPILYIFHYHYVLNLGVLEIQECMSPSAKSLNNMRIHYSWTSFFTELPYTYSFLFPNMYYTNNIILWRKLWKPEIFFERWHL